MYSYNTRLLVTSNDIKIEIMNGLKRITISALDLTKREIKMKVIRCCFCPGRSSLSERAVALRVSAAARWRWWNCRRRRPRHSCEEWTDDWNTCFLQPPANTSCWCWEQILWNITNNGSLLISLLMCSTYLINCLFYLWFCDIGCEC